MPNLTMNTQTAYNQVTTTFSGYPHPSVSAVFLCLLKTALIRLYDGLREPNKIPSGNKFRRLKAVVDYPSPYYGGDLLTKLSGGHHA